MDTFKETLDKYSNTYQRGLVLGKVSCVLKYGYYQWRIVKGRTNWEAPFDPEMFRKILLFEIGDIVTIIRYDDDGVYLECIGAIPNQEIYVPFPFIERLIIN